MVFVSFILEKYYFRLCCLCEADRFTKIHILWIKLDLEVFNNIFNSC